jgi:hypothetical protein
LRPLNWLLIGVLGLLPVVIAQPGWAQGDVPESPVTSQQSMAQGYTYAECNRADEAGVQAEIEAIAQAPLDEASAGLDVDGLVAHKWTELGVGIALDQAVDDAIAQVQQEKSYWDRFVTGWSAPQAEALASEVAAAAFDSPVFQAKLEELATALAAGLVAELEAEAARSASSALLCLQSFVGERYSETLFAAFQQQTSQGISSVAESEAEVNGVAPMTIQPAELHLKAGAGVVAIVGSQVIRKLAVTLSQKITGRLAGKIAGRVLGRLGSSFIPYLGWAVGIGLIAWDLVEGAQGALPQIREALQAEEVKQEVRMEIAAAVRSGLDAEVEHLAATVARTLVGQWQSFCTGQGELCALAAEIDDLQMLLDVTPVEQVARLAQQVTLFLTELGRTQLEASLVDGSFEALLGLPESAYAVLRHTRDPQIVLDWAALAGPSFESMVALELYTQVAPNDLAPETVLALVTLADNDIIHKLLALSPGQLATLVQLSTPALRAVAAGASLDELAWLSTYLAQQPVEEMQRIGAQLASGALTIAALQAPPVAVQPASMAQPKAEAAPGAAVGSMPVAIVEPVAWWEAAPWSNGVVVAAVLVVLLLVACGVVAAQRDSSLRSE